ncbi:MAG: hypothetical protein NZL96_00540 [Patescibacteria group bacterium]|nr:hypothetical protein [Patescibacteria group bacterium]
MNLPLIVKEGGQKREIFLGILLRETSGSLILIEREDQVFIAKDRTDFSYQNGWENLFQDIDENLYLLEERNKITLTKVIFFAYSFLIDEKRNTIREPYLNKIKTIVKEFKFTVLGYVECSEALALSIEKKDNLPFTGILLEIDKTQLGVFAFQGGKVLEKRRVSRTENLVEDFILATEAIREKKLLLPSRILIYNSDHLDKESEKILNYHWPDGYFVDLPQIVLVNQEELINNLVDAFSEEMMTQEKGKKEEAKNSKKNERFGFVVEPGLDSDLKEDTALVKVPFLLAKKFLSPPSFDFQWLVDRNWSRFFVFRKKILIVIFLLSFLSSFVFANEYFLRSSTLTLYLPSRSIQKTLEDKLPYQVLTASAEFSETLSTTGKKEIGEKARGTIKIHNFDDREITLGKGTTVEAKGIKFLTEDDIKVASATLVPDGSAKLPGKKEVSLIALQIGEEGNLPRGTRFKISGIPETICFGVNERDLSGGLKKQLRIVSPTDLRKAEERILKKAKDHQFSLNLKKTEKLINDLSEYQITKKNSSKEVGEEAESLTLTATVTVNFYSFDGENLREVLKEKISREVDKNFIIPKETIEIKVNNPKKIDSQIQASIAVNARAIPNLDQRQIVRSLRGKNLKKADLILKEEFKVGNYHLDQKNALPIVGNYLPFFEKNLKIEIKYL